MDKGISHNLQEFAVQNNIKDLYGSIVATMPVNQETFESITKQLKYVNFYTIFVLVDGEAEVIINDNNIILAQQSVIRMTHTQNTEFVKCTDELDGYFLFCETNFYNNIIEKDPNMQDVFQRNILDTYIYFDITEAKISELLGIISQVEKTISQPHIYKTEMLSFLVHLAQMHINELIDSTSNELHDMKHKENIFKIFIHLASNNFKRERQINFYADRMNITSTYLSRIVREVSGNTVCGYLQSFLYSEACKMLKMTDKTIGEISTELKFNDQSAF
ncbi:MAG: helix-turn-helix transcriptional regulator, partial [Prevotella sp.]|nr:helix-turn-helix transcriptional regulator [Prevotella sp.]MBP9983459.1 helix-turn-helix transcriptional regulator [Prevotella sp.]